MRSTKETYKTKWWCNAKNDTSIREGCIYIRPKGPTKETYTRDLHKRPIKRPTKQHDDAMQRTTHQSEKGVIYIRQKRPIEETLKKNLPAKEMMMQCKGRHIITRRAYMYYTKETYEKNLQKRPTKETYKTKWRCNAKDDTSIREGRIYIIQKRPIKETCTTKWRCNAKNDTSIREE